MKLTTKSEYSLLTLIFIARNYEKGYVKVDDLCKYYDMPKKYIEQLVTILKLCKIIKTKRGANGGITLASPPDKINLAEIVRAMDGALAPTESVSKYFFGHTPLEKDPKLLTVFKDIRDYIATKLENTTLADLI